MRNALIFGTGDYYQKKKSAITDYITGFADNYKSGIFEEKNIYKVDELQNVAYDVIYVMANEDVFADMVYQLLDAGVKPEEIIIGQNLLPQVGREALYLDKTRVIIIDDDCRLCYQTEDIKISFSNYDELCGIQDIFGEMTYDYCLKSTNNIVIDVGMNIGAASLYFSMREDVDRVYSFEPFPDTYQHALQNISYNTKLKSKIVPKNVGLSNVNSVEEVQYNNCMTCGMTTQKNLFDTTVNTYKSWGLYQDRNEKLVQIELADAALEFEQILSKYNGQGYTFILKLDCEGAEYNILERLNEKNLTGMFSIIMLEWHYMGKECIEEYLKKEGFSYFCFRKNENMGVVYAVK